MTTADPSFWQVLPAAGETRMFSRERAARRLQRKYARLGIQSSLYSGDGKNWDLVRRLDGNGREYTLEGDHEAPDGGEK